VLIAPSVKVSGMTDRDQQAAAIQAGYDAARTALPAIRGASSTRLAAAAHLLN
jgi:hypothetical protein